VEVEMALEQVLGLVPYQPLNVRLLKEAKMLMTMTEKAAEKDMEADVYFPRRESWRYRPPRLEMEGTSKTVHRR